MPRYFKTLQEIKIALDNNIPVYWENTSYKVHYIEDKKIRVTCISNYFGSLIQDSEIGSCFTVN